ncbi:MAG: DUF1592 domain-containing protein [Pirellula sp.]
MISRSMIVLRQILALTVFALSTWVAHVQLAGAADEDPLQTVASPSLKNLLGSYCVDCHSGSNPIANLDVASLTSVAMDKRNADWEKVVRKLRTRQMPPADADRPDEREYVSALSFLEQSLDTIAKKHPQPGRTSTFRRLTRTEYQNVIRDFLGIHIDVQAMLPADEVSKGFDNITVGELSPTLLNRYISAAQYVSRIAIARPLRTPDGKTFRIAPDVTQEEHVEGLPLGTRGGLTVPYTFPADGQYEIRVRLSRDRNEEVEGLSEPHQLEVLLDSTQLESFTVRPPRGRAKRAATEYDTERPTHASVDQHLVVRFQANAGEHKIGVTFVKNRSSLLETERQPLNVHYNFYRHPRQTPAIYQVSVTGPLDARADSKRESEPLSRQKVFTCYPSGANDEEACARRIIADLLRRACRSPITSEDLARPMELYHAARSEGSFEDGIEMALSSIMIHPRFLFRIEQEPANVGTGKAYRVNDFELASRLSFFLWSSIPDEELLRLAELGKLGQPEVLEAQVRRLLADPRSSALVTNFAGQWLYLRNLDSATPDARLFPDFDDNLRQAFRTETEMFFESILREDRSALELIKSNYTFLNERLAKHYGIPHVYGSRFRRVALNDDSHRGGLFRHGSVLTVTSYATRTSPVIRGKWILENILGTPPPPPPDNVPALTDNVVSAKLPVRERFAQHRADPACASCHILIDPPGFALENYDAVGRWRDLDNGRPVDAKGGLPGGFEFDGTAGLEQGLLKRPELFVATMTEKLLTYALGRGLEHYDATSVRQILRSAEADNYRFSSIALGIVNSIPFQMRTSP